MSPIYGVNFYKGNPLTHVPLALAGVGLSMNSERKKMLLMRTSSFGMIREIKTLITLG